MSDSATPQDGKAMSPASVGSQPVAWAVESRRGVWLALHPTQERAEYEARAYDESGTAFPVYRQPTLTDAEREAIELACDEGRWYPADYHHIQAIRGLLERLA